MRRRPRQPAARLTVLLDRQVVFHRIGGTIIEPSWAQLHYPLYWRYDVLGGLKGLAEVGMATDERCVAALDLLESLELPDGGWPAHARYYRGSGERRTGHDHVDWGGVDARRPNPWVTVDALAVLAGSGAPVGVAEDLLVRDAPYDLDVDHPDADPLG